MFHPQQLVIFFSRPRFLNGGLHLDFEALPWSKLVETWGNETEITPQPIALSLVDSHSFSQATTAREIEGSSLWGV